MNRYGQGIGAGFGAALAVLAGVGLAHPAVARAETFTVNTLEALDGDDAPRGDFIPGDGVCDADGSADGEQCTLYAAVEEANLSEEADRIEFSVTGTIALNGAVAIRSPLEIVGPGADMLTVSGEGRSAIFTATHPTPASPSPPIDVQIRGIRMLDAFGDSVGNTYFARRGVHTVLEDCIVEGSDTSSDNTNVGGAIYTNAAGPALTMRRCVARGNRGGRGGAILGLPAATSPMQVVVVEDSLFVNNTAYGSAGAIGMGNSGYRLEVRRSVFVGNTSETRGGAIAWGSGSAFIKDSTFVSNSAGTSGGALSANGFSSRIASSTFHGNQAGTDGGAMTAAFRTHLSSLTITGNTAGELGGGARFFNYTGRIQNTIIAENSAATGDDCSGALSWTSGGYNLIGDATDCDFPAEASDQLGDATTPLDARLGPLTGGAEALQYRVPLSDSPALDAGNPDGCTWDANGDPRDAEMLLETDQRGGERTIDATGTGTPRCDVGAIEALGAGQARFATDAVEVYESEGAVAIEVERVGSSGVLRMAYASMDESAGGADYEAVSGTWVWEDGDDSPKQLTMPIADDGEEEPSETFVVALQGRATAEPSELRVTIRDGMPPEPDAGVSEPPADGGTSPDAAVGSEGDGGAPPAMPPAEGGGGCSVTSARAPSGPFSWLFGLALLLGGLRRSAYPARRCWTFATSRWIARRKWRR
jgi:predicted outer membrane repeat protein